MTYNLETIRAAVAKATEPGTYPLMSPPLAVLLDAARNGLLEDADIGRDAATEITRLRARVAELEAALERIANECGTNLGSKD